MAPWVPSPPISATKGGKEIRKEVRSPKQKSKQRSPYIFYIVHADLHLRIRIGLRQNFIQKFRIKGGGEIGPKERSCPTFLLSQIEPFFSSFKTSAFSVKTSIETDKTPISNISSLSSSPSTSVQSYCRVSCLRGEENSCSFG